VIFNLLGYAPFLLQLVTGIWLWRANSSDSNMNPLPATVNHILSTVGSAVILVILFMAGRTGLLFWVSAAMTGYSAWWFFGKLTKR
jgi:hypothetical protein